MAAVTRHTDLDLAVRVSRLERELRIWKLSLVIVVVVLLVPIVQASPPAAVVEAQKFVLRDADNRVRAVLGTEFAGSEPTAVTGFAFGQYGLHFYDADRQYRAGMSEVGDAAGSWQLQFDGKRTPSAVRLLAADGLALLTLLATEQVREVVNKQEEAWGKRFNAAKTPVEREKLLLDKKFDGVSAGLSAFPKGTSSLTLKHGLGGGLDFFLHRRQASLHLMDERGVTRATLGHTKLERVATGVAEERPVSSLVLLDKSANVIWKAP
jgi:hypothetical protein